MQWIKSFFFFTLAIFACNAYAEYYFVYPAPAVACVAPCYGRPHHRVVHKKKPRCHKYYKTYRVVKHYKRIVPTCSYGCGAVCSPPPCESRCGGYGVYRPMAYRYYYDDDYYYDPDLATGDDYQSIHPDLNIDY